MARAGTGRRGLAAAADRAARAAAAAAAPGTCDARAGTRHPTTCGFPCAPAKKDPSLPCPRNQSLRSNEKV